MPQTPLDKAFGARASHTFRGGSRPARADTCQEGELNEEPIVPSSAALLREPPPREVPMSQVEVSEQVSPHGDADPASLQPPESTDAFLVELLAMVNAARTGIPGVRMSTGHQGVAGEVAAALNELVELNTGLTGELQRVSRVRGRA